MAEYRIKDELSSKLPKDPLFEHIHSKRDIAHSAVSIGIDTKDLGNRIPKDVYNLQMLVEYLDDDYAGGVGVITDVVKKVNGISPDVDGNVELTGLVKKVNDYTPDSNGNVVIPNLVQDANYVHTDNNYTNADKGKVNNLPLNTLNELQNLIDELDYCEILIFGAL